MCRRVPFGSAVRHDGLDDAQWSSLTAVALLRCSGAVLELADYRRGRGGIRSYLICVFSARRIFSLRWFAAALTDQTFVGALYTSLQLARAYNPWYPAARIACRGRPWSPSVSRSRCVGDFAALAAYGTRRAVRHFHAVLSWRHPIRPHLVGAPGCACCHRHPLSAAHDACRLPRARSRPRRGGSGPGSKPLASVSARHSSPAAARPRRGRTVCLPHLIRQYPGIYLPHHRTQQYAPRHHQSYLVNQDFDATVGAISAIQVAIVLVLLYLLDRIYGVARLTSFGA